MALCGRCWGGCARRWTAGWCRPCWPCCRWSSCTATANRACCWVSWGGSCAGRPTPRPAPSGSIACWRARAGRRRRCWITCGRKATKPSSGSFIPKTTFMPSGMRAFWRNRKVWRPSGSDRSAPVRRAVCCASNPVTTRRPGDRPLCPAGTGSKCWWRGRVGQPP